MSNGLGRVVAGFTLAGILARSKGVVTYLARHEKSDLEITVRDFSLAIHNDDASRARILRELTILKSDIRTPFIIRLFDTVEERGHVYFLCEKATHSTLKSCIERHGHLPISEVRRIFSQLVATVDVLHSQMRICHRNIEPENILLDRYNNIRLIDFGTYRQLISMDSVFTDCVGVGEWPAPEIIRRMPYTKAVDLWSLGLVLYYMAVGRPPFQDIAGDAILRKIVAAQPVFPTDLDQCVVDLIQKLLDKEPECRITIEEVESHPFFEGIDWEELRVRPAIADTDVERFLVDHGIDQTDPLMRSIARHELEVAAMKKLGNTELLATRPPVVAKKRECAIVDTRRQMRLLAKSMHVTKRVLVNARGALTDVSSDLSPAMIERARSDF